MALGSGVFLTQTKILPGSYINFESEASARTSSSQRLLAGVVPISMIIDNDGNLQITYNKSLDITFELDDRGNLYVSYDGEYGVSFKLDDRGYIYILEE